MQNSSILIVDDEEINLNFFDVMLSKLGFTVFTASNGEDALDSIRENQPDLVMLDNIMPKLSGWEVTRIVKNDAEYDHLKDTPIIMFSAMDDVQDKIEGFELGVEDYITKPFNFSEVLARIKAVLRDRELSQQVLRRERRIALIESLNKSLVHFSGHLEGPVTELKQAANKLDPTDTEAVKRFVTLVGQETAATLGALEELQTEIRDLSEQDEELREGEVTVAALDAKYQRSFSKLRETDLDEVQR
jgi:DNA-binding response OmpR family regulator